MLNAYDNLSSKDSIAYEEPQGFSGLRHILGGYLYLSRGVKCSAEQIIFTSGHQQSMNIIANLINNPHFKWGSNFDPSGAFLWFRQRRDFAVPFLPAAS